MVKEIQENVVEENKDKESDVKNKKFELVLDMSKMEDVYKTHKELFERLKYL